MNEQKKKYKVTIFGETYSLVTDEPEQHFMQSVHLVDSLMHDFAKNTGSQDAKKIASLIALQLASKVIQLEFQLLQNDHSEQRLTKIIDQELETVGS